MADAEKSETQINIKVSSQDNETFFRIKRTTPLGKLMNSFCERNGRAVNSVRFMYDGKRVEAHVTPDDMDMEEGDTIDAMVEQQGGV